MRKTTLILLVLFISFAFGQRGGSRGGWSQQRQVDPKKVPKIGVVYGTVIDSSSNSPIPYASISIINSRSNTIINS